MNPRQAAFSLLRRAALQGLNVQACRIIRYQPSSFRSLSYQPTSAWRDVSSRSATTSPFQIPKAKFNPPRPERPEYEMTFTCKPCSSRSTHKISKQGYHHGSVLITCPECKNRHVISDHLKIFGDQTITIEDLMRDKGQLVKKGTLSEDGDLEFWEDGSTTDRKKVDDA